MGVRDFDRDFAAEVIDRLAELPADRVGNWGVMKAPDLVPHLTHAMLWSMGRREAPAFVGNWVTKNLVWPAFRLGLLSIPKNVKIPIRDGAANPNDSLADLQQVLADYLSEAELGALKTAPHPLFGDIGVDGWALLHVKHFEHHFKQFDL